MHIPANGQDVGITDGVPARSEHEKLPVEELHDAQQLIVGHNLLEVEFNVGKDRRQALLVHVQEAGIDDRLGQRSGIGPPTLHQADNQYRHGGKAARQACDNHRWG